MSQLYTDFNLQYNSIYKSRLSTMRQHIHTYKCPVLDTILDLNKFSGECCVVGVTFISSDFKETIFDRLDKTEAVAQVKKYTYISNDAKYFIEDNNGRIEFAYKCQPPCIITSGMCLGLIGTLVKNVFHVHDFVFPQELHNTLTNSTNAVFEQDRSLFDAPRYSEVHNKMNNDRKMAFLSGICIDNANNNSICLRVTLDYLHTTGIDTVIIFGKLYKDFEQLRKLVDKIEMEIILVPEYNDFGCKTYPLLPVHSKLFSKHIKSLENPCVTTLLGYNCVFTSKCIIDDILKYKSHSIGNCQQPGDGYRMHLDYQNIDANDLNEQDASCDDVIDAVLSLHKCRHLCPNAPDTISIMPDDKVDSLFIDRAIDYYIVPNCDTTVLKKTITTNILTLPVYDTTKQVVVLNVDKNEYEIFEFK